MRYSLLFFLLVVCSNFIIAQTHNHEYCGTHDQDFTWLKKYQQNPELFPMPEEDLLVIALQVHNVGNDDGTALFPTRGMLDALCTLQGDFLASDIQFYLSNGINEIFNTEWNNHETFGLGSQLMNQNRVPNMLNTYITTEAAGNCGYYSGGPDACVVAKGCNGPSERTWAHELGHYLSLPHPFLGWEGIDYDPNVPTSTYQNQNWNNIESVNGNNCNIAGDGFCDTPPDYISNRWGCNGDSESGTLQTDLNGETFRSDGTLIMSYSLDACQSRFSQEQTDAMRANLLFERPSYILDMEIEEIDLADFNTIYPQEGDAVAYNYLEVAWDPIPGATHYFVEVGRHPWDVVIASGVTTETNFVATDLVPNKDYFYRLRPYNMGYFCAGTTEKVIFSTSELTAVNELAAVNGINVYPTILKNGQALTIDFNADKNFNEANVLITSVTGAQQLVETTQIVTGKNSISVRPNNLSNGIYFVTIETEEGRFNEKFIVQ